MLLRLENDFTESSQSEHNNNSISIKKKKKKKKEMGVITFYIPFARGHLTGYLYNVLKFEQYTSLHSHL